MRAAFTQCQASDEEDSAEDPMDCLLKSNKGNQKALPVEPYNSKMPMEFKVVVPDGVVCAVHPQRASNVLWKYKFDSPIVQAWTLVGNNVFVSF